MAILTLAKAATMTTVLSSVAACGQGPVTVQETHHQTGGGIGGVLRHQVMVQQAEPLKTGNPNGDGRIHRFGSNARPRSDAGDPTVRFTQAEANNDGFINRSEIDAMLRRHVDRIDPDRNGIITPAERVASQKSGAPSGDNG